MQTKSLSRMAILIALLLGAMLLPPTEVDAKVSVPGSDSTASVDVYYDWAVAGNETAEQVRIYRFDGVNWQQTAIIEPDVPTPGFGHTVAVGRGVSRQQPVVVIGAPDSDTVFLYGVSGTTTQLVATIVETPGSGFGESVDTSAGVVIVGAPFAGGEGAAFLYSQTGAPVGNLANPGLALSSYGAVVQIESNTAWVSAPGAADNIGAVVEFEVSTGTVVQTLTPPNGTPGLRFGSSLASDPARVLVGAASSSSAWLQQGVNQTEIAASSGATITDVALEGNLIAFNFGDTGLQPIEVLTDNGSTGNFTFLQNVSVPNLVATEIVLGGGHILIAGNGEFADPERVFAAEFIDDGQVDKILPPLGRQQTQFGNHIDVDANTMVSGRGTTASSGQIVVSKFNGGAWATDQLIDIPTGPFTNGIAVEGNTMVASIGDQGNVANPLVAVFTRPDEAAPFAFATSFRTQSGRSPRVVAIDETGEYLALGLPVDGQVEVHFGGPLGWGNTPQVFGPNDSQGTGTATFGWDLDFGEGFLLIGKPATTSLGVDSGVPGMAEQWRVNPNGFTFFGDRIPGDSAPGDAAGWAVEIEPGLRAVASPRLGTVQVYRSGAGDGRLNDPSPNVGTNWGYAMDLDAGVLVVTDWVGETIAYDLYGVGVNTVLDTFQAADNENDYAASTFPLATSGGTVMVGARLEDWQGRDAGAVYTFSVTPSDPPQPAPVRLPVVDIDADYAVVGNPAQDLVHVLFNDGNGWAEVQQVVGQADTGFGAAVSLEGDRLAVGAPDVNGGIGQIVILSRQGNQYINPVAFNYSGATTTDDFGANLDLSGDWLIAGAPVETGSGSVVIFNQRTGNQEFVASSPIADDQFGSAVALGFLGTDAEPRLTAAWVGAPSDQGAVYGYGFNGTTWAATSQLSGATAGENLGAAIEGNGSRLATLAPTPGAIGSVDISAWTTTGLTGTSTVVNPISAVEGGAVAYSGDVLAAGSPLSSEITLWSDNGADLAFSQTLILASAATGRSLAIDGQWLIAATNASATDWTQLASLSNLALLAPQPNTPITKVTPELATDAHHYSSALAVSDDTIVVAAGGNFFASAIGELAVLDRTNGDQIIQRFRRDNLIGDGAWGPVDIDGDRMVAVQGESVFVYERSGPGAIYDVELASIGANAVTGVDLDGDLLVIGQANQNQARVFEFNGGGFAEVGLPLVPAFAQPGDAVGIDVAVSGDVIIVGADRSETTIPQQGYLTVWTRPDAASPFVETGQQLLGAEHVLDQFDGLGSALAFDGTYLVAGAPLEDRNAVGDAENQGVIYVWAHGGGGTFPEGASPLTLDPRGVLGGDDIQAMWGTDVALSEGTIAVGGPGFTGTGQGQGAIISYQFDPTDNAWLLSTFNQGSAIAADAEPGDALGTTVAIAGLSIVAGAPGEDASGNNAGALYLAQVDPAPTVNPEPDNKLFSEPGSDLSDGEIGDIFGYNIDTDGVRLVVGAPEWSTSPLPIGTVGSGATGGVYVFTRNADGTGWDYEQFVENPDPSADAPESEFGQAVAIDGDTLVVGAPGTGNNSTGAAWVIDLATSPTTAEQINPADLAGSARYGVSVDVEGGTIVVGSDQNDFDPNGNPVPSSNFGRFVVWQDSPTGWQNVFSQNGDTAGDQYGVRVIIDSGNIAASTLGNNAGYVDVWRPDGAGSFVADPRIIGPSGSQFGLGLDLAGDQLVVGAPNAETASLYTWDGSTWGSAIALTPSSAANGDDYGFSVAIEGTVIVVGEPAHDDTFQNQGRVHVFGNTALNEWTVIDEFVAPDPADQDWLGFSVKIIDGQVIGAAPFDDNVNGLDAGAAYLFEVTAPDEPIAPNKIIAEIGSDPSDGEAGDLFAGVATDGQRLVIAAPENNNTDGTGGVHIYDNVDGEWQFATYIENPDADAINSTFGLAADIEGDLVVVGAPFAETAAGAASGTVWLFDLSTDPVTVTELPAPSPRASHFYGISIDLDGDILAVGARGAADDGAGGTTPLAGELHIFERDAGGIWVNTLIRPGQAEGDQYTAGLALDGERVAAGALAANGAGYVEVLRRTAPGLWAVQDTFLGAAIDDQFGFGLDLDANNLAVAAPGVPSVTMFTFNEGSWDDGVVFSGLGEAGNLTSIDIDGTVAIVGDPFFDDPVNDAGRAVVYGNTAWREWTELASFGNQDPQANDFFGASVGAFDGALFIGAPRDDNRNGVDAGAVYLYDVTAPPPPDPPITTDPTFIAELTYELPATVMPGATSVTIEGTSVATTSAGATAGGGLASTSIRGIDFNPDDGSSLALGEITLGELGIDANGLGLNALMQIPLTEFPVEGGWAQYLAGTEFQGLPLQVVTLGQIWNLPIVQNIELRATDIESSPIQFVDISAVAFGGLELLSIEIEDPTAATNFEAWCNVFASQGTSCAELGITADSTVTLGTIAAAGISIESTPIQFVPIQFVYLESTGLAETPIQFVDIAASPIQFVPIQFVDIAASPIQFVPIQFVPIQFVPIQFVPIQFVPIQFVDIASTPIQFVPIQFVANQAIVDCTTGAIDCSTATLGDAAAAGLLVDGITLADIGADNLDGMTLDELFAGLTEASQAAFLAVFADQSISLADLVAQFGTEVLGSLTLGDIDPEAFVVVPELATMTVLELLQSLPEEILSQYTLGDFLLLFIPRQAYDWNSVDLGAINLQLAGLQAPLVASVAFATADGPPVDDVTLIIDLPAGAVLQPGAFALAPTGARIASVTSDDTTATVNLTNVASGVPQTLTFRLYQGLDLGSSSSLVTASVDLSSASAFDTITVVEAFEPENNSLLGAVPVISDNLYISHIGRAGDADFFRLTVTEPATTVSVQLANLAADFDLVVYGPRLGSIIPVDDNAAGGAPTADFDASGTGGVLSPVPLQDLPTSLDELQVYGASYFRGSEAEQVDFLAIEAADYYVQVTGYLGASSPEPYSLRAATTSTVELPCPTRTFAFSGATPGNNTAAAGADTLVLMNRSRFESLYGPTATTDMLVAVDAMIATAAANGVNATVLDLDAFASIQSAYDAWDASPCSAIAVNNVAGAISAEILAIRSGQLVDNLLIIGGDDVVPFARVKDATTIANEQSYTNTFTAAANNALRSAFSGGWVLTDDPYADDAATPIANTDRVVYVPEVAMGRLVETPEEIIGALQNYVIFNGQLDPQTGFVAGYDFLDDGAEQTGDRLEELTSPGAVRRLINETWTAAELEAELATGPDTALISAHFDHANALPAAGNQSGDLSTLFDVTDAEALDFTGSILFSVGCHGGLSVSDLLVAPTGVVSQDWAQTILGGGAAAFVGNTGYGYGDDTAVALSEKLMADFAAGLSDYETVGEALLYAKQGYAADLTVYGAFDEKALMEATLYGIPFYTLSNVVVPDPVPDPPTDTAVTGGESYTDVFDPAFDVTDQGGENEVWSTPGDNGEDQVQVTNGYPILPRYEWEVTQQDAGNPRELELEARGVVLESLVTRDEVNVDPATARAVYDLAANEPNNDASDVTFILSPAISTYLSPEGLRQDVNMAAGAFQSTNSDGSGTMRLFEEFEATVYYAENPNAETGKPVITNAQANTGGETLNLAVTVLDESPIVRVLALVSPPPLPNQATTWELVELSQAGGKTWQGSVALTGDEVQWILMAVDTHGNTGWSLSKQLAFTGNVANDFAPVLYAPQAPDAPVVAGEQVSLSSGLYDFDGSADSIGVTWDFGDGTTCSTGSDGSCELEAPTDADPFGSTSATHRWAEPGTYTVTATATDVAGRTDTITLGPIVVEEPPPSQVAVVANGSTRGGISDDDILPVEVGGRQVKINLSAGNIEGDDFNVRFTVHKRFDFRGTDLSSVTVVGSTATVVGSGVLDRNTDDELNVEFRVTIDDATDTVVLTLWQAGSDIDSASPLYRLTAILDKENAIKIWS